MWWGLALFAVLALGGTGLWITQSWWGLLFIPCGIVIILAIVGGTIYLLEKLRDWTEKGI